MSEIAELEKQNKEYMAFILEQIQSHGEPDASGKKRIVYKKLNELCEQKFEGLRLLLKTMKKNKQVNYDGVICMDPNAFITLL
eukprot:TRINITY_DN785_c0_g1_i1.p1 TRINITY_DN785_c0_g1~~TRINITY_DN785_c0_g1_i1.p1  ORF type:complete len:83 (-),score=9.00 TRINITY_DN785_c0_g1_i1:93-341(-)